MEKKEHHGEQNVRNDFEKPLNDLLGQDAQESEDPPPYYRGRVLLEEASQPLTTEEKEALQKYTPLHSHDLNAAIDTVYDATLDRQRECRNRRWKWKFGDRTIFLQDKANKVLLWLDRCKSVGDIIANVDPVHVGLPWAGIRLILGGAVADARQMAALLTGVELVFERSNRLKVYSEYLDEIPETLAKSNLRNALIKVYTSVLRFLAQALLTYQKNPALRKLQSLWQTNTIASFEAECDTLGSRLEIEANSCDRELRSQHHKQASHWKADLDEKLKSLDMIKDMKDSLDALQEKIDLSALTIAEGASYDSFAEGEFALCLEGTRTEILHQITEWVDDPAGKGIYWLCGMAGTGKSTISRTLAHQFDRDQQRLGASFFFKRGQGDRGNARRFFPTIAAQLADQIPGMGHALAEALRADPRICGKSMKDQYQQLLLDPLRLMAKENPLQDGLVIVVDAMDECESGEDIKKLLYLFEQLQLADTLRLRVFVTSRPELPLRLGFGKMSERLHHDVRLEEVQPTTIEQDIRTYLRHEFSRIKGENGSLQTYNPLPEVWPEETDLESLVTLTVPLFIFAFTVCRYISGSGLNPQKRLNSIIQQQRYKSLSGIAKTYLPILTQIIDSSDEHDRDELTREIQEVLGPLVLLADSLSARSLAELLQLALGDVDERLGHLHSVLNIPTSPDMPIRLLHLSFRDFLIDKEVSKHNPFWVDESKTNHELAMQCIKLLSRKDVLSRDICNVVKPGTRRTSRGKDEVAACISTTTAYACKYWVSHVSKGGEKLRDDGEVHRFLKAHFLHWLEALAWLGRLSSSVAFIETLRSMVEAEQGTQLLAFLNDADRFVRQSWYIVDLAPLQLYSSALVFAPQNSIVRRHFATEIPKWLKLLPKVPAEWTSMLYKIEHEDHVEALEFSPDSKVIASAAGTSLFLWDMTTGEAIDKLDGHTTDISSIAFSPDGQLLASVTECLKRYPQYVREGLKSRFTPSDDGLVRLWDPKTGRLIRSFAGQGSVAFSPDGQRLATLSSNGTETFVWNVETSEVVMELKNHDACSTALCFSASGQILASALTDLSVTLWDTVTGQKVHELIGHDDWVTALSFCQTSSGEVLASGSFDRSVKVWNCATGDEVLHYSSSGEEVYDMTVSPGKTPTLLVGMWNGTVSQVSLTTGGELQKFEIFENVIREVACSANGEVLGAVVGNAVFLHAMGLQKDNSQAKKHDGWAQAFAFSPDGKLLASGGDSLILLWDSDTGEAMQQLEGHGDDIRDIKFSSARKQILASASFDHTVRLWDLATGDMVYKLEGHSNWVWSLAFSHVDNILASASYDGTVRIWDTDSGKALHKLEGHEDAVNSIVFSPDGQTLASGSSYQMHNSGQYTEKLTDFTTRTWDIQAGKALRVFGGHKSFVEAVAFSPDGRVIASASREDGIRLWDLETGEQVLELGYGHWIGGLAFSANAELLASCSINETLTIWSLASQKAVQQFESDFKTDSLSFTADGHSLETNTGRFELTRPHSSPTQAASKKAGLVLFREWLRYGDEDLLWLPREYRGQSAAFRDNTFALGQYSGDVTFIKVDEMLI